MIWRFFRNFSVLLFWTTAIALVNRLAIPAKFSHVLCEFWRLRGVLEDILYTFHEAKHDKQMGSSQDEKLGNHDFWILGDFR